MAKKVYVTITGISAKDEGKNLVSVGSQILLVKEPENSFDSNAIKVFTSDKTYSVGYVANSTHTVTKGTISAKELNEIVSEDSVLATITKVVDIPFRNGHISKGYVAEVNIEAGDVKQVKDKNNKFTFKLIGSKTMYPNKQKVLEELKAGNAPLVKLFIQDDKIVASFDDVLCGYVDSKATLSNYDELMEAVGEERIAKIVSTAGLNLIGEFTVSKAEVEVQKSRKSLKTIIDELVSEKIATHDEINERLTYLKECGLTDKQIKGILNTYVRYDDPEVAKRIPEKPKTLYKDPSDVMMRSVVYINGRSNLLLEGPKGVGKNVLAETLAWVYKRPLYEVSLNSQHDNHSLLGGKSIEIDEEGDQRVVFEEESLVQASKHGGILVLDEFNTSIPHVMSVLNSLLDERRRLEVPGFEKVIAHKNFTAIATQNRDYQGTFENNEATIERFVPIILDEPNSIEEILLAKFESADYETIRTCNTLYQMIKKCVEDGQISDRAITIRGFVDAIKATEMDLPLKTALTDNITNRARDDFERTTIKNMIEDLLG